jgi:hypothetical protein
VADIINHSLTAKSNSNITVAVITIQGQIVDSSDQSKVIADFTGANAIDFALRVPGFSVADHKELADRIAQFIMRRKAGLE